MSAKSVYIDSNIFISPLIYEDASDEAADSRMILGMVERGELVAYTSNITWDEVVWVVRRVLAKADSTLAGEKLLSFPNLRFVSASEEVVRSAQRLLVEYALAPRDAIHLASALSRSVDVVLSDDPDLDVLEERLKREGSRSFAQRVARTTKK